MKKNAADYGKKKKERHRTISMLSWKLEQMILPLFFNDLHLK